MQFKAENTVVIEICLVTVISLSLVTVISV